MLKVEKKKQKFQAHIEVEMTIYNASELKKKFMPLMDETHDLVVNLSKVTEIDSAGVQLLMLLKKERAIRGKTLTLIDHSNTVLDVFELIGLVTYFSDPVVLPKGKI